MSIPELLRNHRRVAGPLLALHGPNLNLLGEREPHLYGRVTLAELDQYLIQHARAAGASLRAFAGLTHTSIALRDALDDCASGAENRDQKTMDLRKLKTLIDLVAASGISELEMSEGEDKVWIVKDALPAAPFTPAQTPPHAVSASDAHESASAPPEQAPPQGHVLTSPMVGTFYRAPSPEAAPFVQVGDPVEKGQTIGIIEAMKLLNEIEADEAGIVKEFLVENGQAVEYGQPLLRISA